MLFIYASCIQGVLKNVYILRDVIYALLFEVELNYGSSV
jgi:hypothetical protein